MRLSQFAIPNEDFHIIFDLEVLRLLIKLKVHGILQVRRYYSYLLPSNYRNINKKTDKGESIWDQVSHRDPNIIADGSTGDDAAKSYEFYKEDVKALKDIGVSLNSIVYYNINVYIVQRLSEMKLSHQMNFYRFSISWPRILPNGDTSVISEIGLQYYDNLINELLANGIQPMPTIYHWDLPLKLQKIGGWTNRLIVNHFVEYARVVFDRYADRVIIVRADNLYFSRF